MPVQQKHVPGRDEGHGSMEEGSEMQTAARRGLMFKALAINEAI